MATPPLRHVATYERRVAAPIARVWENVHDWEHLPWLHAESFRAIELVDRGDWGWRARIGLHGAGDILLELVVEDDRRYVSRTLEGRGVGTEIWTTLDAPAPEETDVQVAFLVPGVDAASADAVGAGFTALYTRLWDEDEAMIRHRAAMLASGGDTAGPSEPDPLDLGPEAEVRARAPFTVRHGARSVRIALADGALVAHSAVCPHWLGPLDDAPVEAGTVTCPWHGYRFDVRSGRRCDDPTSRLRLAPVPDLVVDPASGRVRLVPAGG